MQNMRISMRGWIGGCLLLLVCGGALGTTVTAQTPAVLSDQLGWSQEAGTDEIPLLTYAIYIDGVRQPLSGVTCQAAATTGYDCAVPFPAMTPGDHIVELIAIRTDGALVLESPKSAPFAVRVVVAPQAPTNLRIVR